MLHLMVTYSDEATRTAVKLTTKHILQGIEDNEGSKDSMNDDVMDYEGVTAAHKGCDESMRTTDVFDILGSAYSQEL